MALLTPSANVSMDAGSGGLAPHISDGLVAGEALLAGAPCYIAAAGTVFMCNGTAAGVAVSNYAGFTARATAIGQPVSLFGAGAKFEYSTGMTPGAKYFMGATAGRLDTAATTGGTAPIAQAVTATMIRVIASFHV